MGYIIQLDRNLVVLGRKQALAEFDYAAFNAQQAAAHVAVERHKAVSIAELARRQREHERLTTELEQLGTQYLALKREYFKASKSRRAEIVEAMLDVEEAQFNIQDRLCV